MNKLEIKDRLLKILDTHTRDKGALDSLTNKSILSVHLNINSAEYVELIMDFEDEFDVFIDNQTMARILTFENAIDEISELLENK